jgi:hypothetical protein
MPRLPFDVEDLFFIPPGPLADIASIQTGHVLSADAAAVGCPRCRVPIKELFCYRPDPRWPLRRRDVIHARCQRCGRQSSMFGDDDFPPQ